MELNKLIERIHTFNYDYTKPTLKTKIIKGNQQALSQFNWEMQKRAYYRDLNNQKKGFKQNNKKNFDNIDDIQKTLQISRLQKSWGKLDKVSKLEKLTEFIKSQPNKRELQKKLYPMFEKGLLRNKIKYDKVSMKIEKINY